MVNKLYREFGKRGCDLSIAIVSILVLSPILLLVAIMVRAFLGPRVLYQQVRAGYLGKPFVIYKFRTMTDARDALGNLLDDEQRLTRFGKLLRATSLDELPELWNVIKGEMSLVGPRPLLMEYLPRYSPAQFRRHEVKPGITGLAQVSGRNSLSWEDRFAHDLQYIQRLSPQLDLQIVLKTFVRVLQRDGISAHEHVTSPLFLGSESKGPESFREAS